MSGDRVPLYVRLPREQAVALDRLVDVTGRRKQQLVSEMLSDRLTLGRADVLDTAEGPPGEVMTLEEAGALLRVAPDAVRTRAEEGGLPGRRLGGDWRFARSALLAWLLQGEPREPTGGRG